MEKHTFQILKLLLLSVSFLLMFLAFNGLRFSFFFLFWVFKYHSSSFITGTQTIMSSLLEAKLSSVSLSCIYIAFTLSSLLLSSAFVIFVGVKWSLFVGGVLYLGFIVANIYPMFETLIPFAILLGVGAAIIWTAEGSYVTKAAVGFAQLTKKPERSSMGLFNGIFFGIFQLSMLIGNIISSLVLSGSDESSSSSFSDEADKLSSSSSASGTKMNPRAKLLFFIYTGISSIGCIGLLLLPPPEPSKKKDEEKPENVTEGETKTPDSGEVETQPVVKVKNPMEKIIGAIILWKDPRMFLMIPYLLFTGFEQAFIFADFTKQFVRELHGVQNVGFVMSVFGAIDSVFSFFLGRLADRIGARWIGYSGVVLLSLFLGTIRFCRDSTFGETMAAAFMWSALLGIADACIFSVFCNAAMALLFPDKSESAFANVKVFQAGGTALMFFLGPYLSFNTKIYIISGTMLLATICIVILDLRVFPLRPQKKDAVPSENNIQHSQDSEKMPLIKVDPVAE